jgi:hypothetical protein
MNRPQENKVTFFVALYFRIHLHIIYKYRYQIHFLSTLIGHFFPWSILCCKQTGMGWNALRHQLRE